MAVRVLDDAFVSIAGTDYSAYVRSVRMNYSADEVETTTMGDTTHEFMGGLKNWDAQIEWNMDEADNQLGESLFALVGTQVALIIRPDKSEGVGVNNPNYSGTALLVDFPWGGSVGELNTASSTLRSAGTLSRATA